MIKQGLLVPQINTVDLVAHYKLWAGLTTTGEVFDYSLNGNTGTVTGAVPAYPGFAFDASGDEIACGSDSSIDNIFVGGGSASVWLLSDGRGENNEGRVIGKEKWFFHMITNTTTMRFQHNFTLTADEGQWDVTIVAGIWQHILITYDNDLAVNNPIVYLNGVSVSVTEITTPGNDLQESDADDSFTIGDSKDSDRSWDGKIGDVLLFDAEKTAAEAKSIFELSRWRYGV